MLSRSSARPKLVHPAGFDSPARAELGVCIAAKQALEASHAGLEAAKTKLEDLYYTASSAFAAAETGLQEARAAAAAHLILDASGAPGEAPTSIGEARKALLDAEDALVVAEAAREGFASRLDQSAAECARAAKRVREAALAVVCQAPEVTAIGAELLRLQRETLTAGQRLQWLTKAGVLPTVEQPGYDHGKLSDPQLRAVAERFYRPVSAWSDLIPGDVEAYSWDQALDALTRDATAPLPAGVV